MSGSDIAIIVNGKYSSAGKFMHSYTWDFEKNTFDERFTHIGVDDLLKEKLHGGEQVGFQEDHTHRRTQIAVYSAPLFANAVKTALWAVHLKSTANVIHAEGGNGWHRASTFAETLKECANSLVERDGSRRFNAQVFSMLGYTKDDAIATQAEEALLWAQGARSVVRGGVRERDSLFAYDACTTRESAFASFIQIWDFVDYLNGETFRGATTATSSKPDPLPAEVLSERGVSTAKDVAFGYGSSEGFADTGSSVKREVVEGDGRKSDPVSAKVDIPTFEQWCEQENDVDMWAQWAPAEHARDAAPAARYGVAEAEVMEDSEEGYDDHTRKRGHDSDLWRWPHDVDEQPRKYAKVMKEFLDKPWMSVDCPDVGRAWAESLSQDGVDDSALKSLFALAHAGYDGKIAALSIVTKFYKAMGNERDIHKPGAWVHSNVMRAWKNLG
jgi:hypothetical protein